MGKLDAILATYASVYGAMKRKEKLVARKETRRHLSASAGDFHGEVTSAPSDTVVAASSSSSSSSAAPEVPPTLSSGAQSKASTVNHLSVLRDTQRLWMSASAEHRAALEIIAESQYCRGIYPQLRQRLPHVPQYCTMTLNYPDDTDGTTTITTNPTVDTTLKKYDKYQDPSKKYALRLPLYKEAMFRKEPISMDVDDDDDDDGGGGNNDTLLRKQKHSSSTVKKKQRNKAYRMIRISKKEALKECLRRQPHVLRALQQAKRRPARPLTSTPEERPPLVFIDWTKVPRPTRQTAPAAVPPTTTAGRGRGAARNNNSSRSSSGRSSRSGRSSSSSSSGRSSRRRGGSAEEEASKSPDDDDDDDGDVDGDVDVDVDGDESGSQDSETSGSQYDGHRSHSSRNSGRSRRRRLESSATGGGRRSSSESEHDDEDDDEDDKVDDDDDEDEDDEEEINIL